MSSDPYEMQGWQGEEIPLEAQALILMRKYRAAVQVVHHQTMLLDREVNRLLEGADGAEIAEKLQQHPFFIRVMSKLHDSHEKFGDRSYRRNAGEIMDEVRDELEDMITWMSIGLWIMDGAEFPEGLLDMYREEPLPDEEE